MVGTVGITILFLAIIPIAWIVEAFQDARFRRQYRARGRLISRPDLQRRLDRGEGTLLWDATCSRLFWTPDRVRQLGPGPECRTVPIYGAVATEEFEEWCRPRYLDENAGTAFAVAISKGRANFRQSPHWKVRGGADGIVLGLSHAEVCGACGLIFLAKDAECPRCDTRSLMKKVAR